MCLNPLEISYSHIVEITLQDTPNVISRGFSTSICCQGKTRTSNIMDFSLHLPYVRSSQRFCSVRRLNSYSHLSLWWIRALFQLCVMTLTNELYFKKKTFTERGRHVGRILDVCLVSWLKARLFHFRCFNFNIKLLLFFPSTVCASLDSPPQK